MTKTRTLQDIAQAAALALPGYQKTLDKFKASLDDNPAYAFSWGNSAVEAGVRIRLLQDLAAFADRSDRKADDQRTDEEWLTLVIDHYRREMMRLSQDMPSSTSHMSNLVENYQRAYIARIYAWLSGEHFTSL